MQKNRHSPPKKSAASPEVQEDVLAQRLAAFAVDLAESEDGAEHSATVHEALKASKSEFLRIVRKCLLQKKDMVLHEALEHAHEAGSEAYRFLRENIEEASEVVVFRRDDGPDLEVNAFVIPLFAHTDGGLRREQCFQDEDAFDLLRKSFQDAQLESRAATIVLVSHAYHPDELEKIRYSQLNEMVREAFDSMTRKKTAAVAIGHSISGWPENRFAPDDRAVELRFLLGFTLKTLDDPFYRVPKGDVAADRYFDARAARFRQWAQQFAPLVKRCLVTDGRDIDLDFLYQDLFHGGKESGMAEYRMLQLMSDLRHELDTAGVAPENTKAVVGPADLDGEMMLRVNLYAGPDCRLVASADKPMDPAHALEAEADDACDALATIGVKSLALAMRFDAEGQPVDARPYEI